MKLRKWMLEILMICQIMFLFPTTYEAASYNHINKVLTVLEGESLSQETAPLLAIRLIDELEEGALFYLDVTGGKWLEEEFTATVKNTEGVTLEIKRLNGKRLQVKVKGKSIEADSVMYIPMLMEVLDQTASVSIRGNNTVVSSGEYIVAKTGSYKGKVTTTSVPTATAGHRAADIYIEEPFSEAFNKAVSKENCSRKIQLQLKNNDYAFSLADSSVRLIGMQGFEGIEAGAEAVVQIDEQTLEVTLPNTEAAKYSGAFALSGVFIKPSHKAPTLGKVQVDVIGDLVETTEITALQVMDYAIALESESKVVRAGTKQQLNFTLTEKVDESLIRNRPTSFYIEEGGTFIAIAQDKIEVMINGETILGDTILNSNQEVIGFKIPQLKGNSKVYEFSVPVHIGLNQSGKVKLVAEGRSLVETLSTEVFDIYAPFKLTVNGLHTVVGKKDQIGGSILIEETRKGELIQGEEIVLTLEKSALEYGGIPDVTVLSGDIRLGEAVRSHNQIRIPIIRRSNSASSIVISDFNFLVDQTVAEGAYDLTIGGGAFSTVQAQPIWEDAFVWVEERVMEKPEPAPAITKMMVQFTINSPTYWVGEQVKSMDAAPYISKGRTMLPIKYVADAVGIAEEDVFWNHETKTVTLNGKQKVVLQVGSLQMIVDGEEKQMIAAPEIVNGRTFIPVAEITRALGITTNWNSETKQVILEVYKDLSE